ncbi:hypothetical protein [Lysobacter gummosus]|uniref:hypothetical protein n=1 Tax=Lysobacter gummosus TaxID=262324 RepID=UPI0036447EC1
MKKGVRGICFLLAEAWRPPEQKQIPALRRLHRIEAAPGARPLFQRGLIDALDSESESRNRAKRPGPPRLNTSAWAASPAYRAVARAWRRAPRPDGSRSCDPRRWP